MKGFTRVMVVGVSVCVALTVHVRAQGPEEHPRFTVSGELERPADYREWVFLSSGLGMTYGPAKPASGAPPLFDNVFVTRRAYRAFMETGAWPEGTLLVLEGRASVPHASIDTAGQTQGDVRFLEAIVKDSARFPQTTWAFFDFGGGNAVKSTASQIPSTAACYTCHAQNTAVEHTFVQFYPTLFEVATRKGTIKPTYDPNRKF